MRAAIKYIVGSTWQPWLVKYLSKTRTYSYKDIRLQIPASVFHPGFFFSTQLLIRQLKNIDLKNKRFLEPGAGSGLISIYAAKQGAFVTATDINPLAVEYLHLNSSQNDVSLNIIESDLFDKISAQVFDVVMINPPYYKKDPTGFAEYAWNCGVNGEYFRKLFAQLGNYIHEHSTVLMVLCDGCDIEMVSNIAHEHNFTMRTVYTKQNVLETNFIFSLESEK